MTSLLLSNSDVIRLIFTEKTQENTEKTQNPGNLLPPITQKIAEFLSLGQQKRDNKGQREGGLSKRDVLFTDFNDDQLTNANGDTLTAKARDIDCALTLLVWLYFVMAT